MKRKIIFFLMILICLCAISHVSAEAVSDNATDDVVAAEDVNVDNSQDEKLTEIPQATLANGTGEEYNSSADANATPVVKKSAKLKASKMTVALKKGTKWTIKLTDANGNGIANKKITLKVFTGSKYKTVNVNTNSKGVASYNTKSLKAGTHKIQASFADDEYACSDISSSVKVIKQKALKIFPVVKNMKDMSILTIVVMDKKTKKFLNGVKLKLLIYTGKKYKTITLKTKKISGAKGVAGYATNQLSVGKHKVKISPVELKYKGSKTAVMKIKKSAKKYPGMTIKLSG